MYYRCQKQPAKQIKIVVSGGLGDCLLATPFVRYFGQCGQYDRIICAVTIDSAEIFDRNPYISQLIPCQGNDLFIWALPEKDCDVFSPYIKVGNMKKSGSSMFISAQPILSPNLVAKPIVRQAAEYHSIDILQIDPEIYTDPEDENWAANFLRPYKPGPVVLLNQHSKLAEKNLPAGVAQKIVDILCMCCVVLQLTGGDTIFQGAIPVSPMPSVRQSAALFRQLDCIVSVDSFPGHLAYAVHTPAVIIFGPSNPDTFGHPPNRNLRSDKCPPCADTFRKAACKQSLCMEDVSPELIAASAISMISANDGGQKNNKERKQNNFHI